MSEKKFIYIGLFFVLSCVILFVVSRLFPTPTHERRIMDMAEYIPEAIAFVSEREEILDALLELEFVTDEKIYWFYWKEFYDIGWCVSVTDVLESGKAESIYSEAAISSVRIFTEEEKVVIVDVLESIASLDHLGLNASVLDIHDRVLIHFNSRRYSNGDLVEMYLTNNTNLLSDAAKQIALTDTSYVEKISDSWYVEIQYQPRI